MKAIKNKAKIKVNKLTYNPLFVNFLNWQGDMYTLCKIFDRIYESFENDEDKYIVLFKSKNLDEIYITNLINFQRVFKRYINQTISSNNISSDFIYWMDNAFKYIKEDLSVYAKDEQRSLSIIDKEGCWFEGIIVYNFIMTHNYFGSEIIKKCPVCSNFFSNKGKYAKYCSEGCKETGMRK